MTEPSTAGPDLVVAGAARSGTSTLVAHLSQHPDVDMGAVKEPNYFSRHFDRGPDWYDGLFARRTAGLVRLDASTSYTYPQFPEALTRLVQASPDVYVIYTVRDPIARAVSHFLFYRYFFKREPAADFGAALRDSSYYTDVSDYAHWLPILRDLFPGRLLVVPFDALTHATDDVLSRIYTELGIDADRSEHDGVEAHQNQVVEFRSERVRVAVKAVRRTRPYLLLRSFAGANRIRKVRSMLTRDTVLPTTEQVLESCSPDQLADLHQLQTRACAAVRQHLQEQDGRLSLDWGRYWTPASTVRVPGAAP